MKTLNLKSLLPKVTHALDHPYTNPSLSYSNKYTTYSAPLYTTHQYTHMYVSRLMVLSLT